MTFIEPQLINDWQGEFLQGWAAEPKVDGHRAQIHIRERRTREIYTRAGNNAANERGLLWLSDIAWPVEAAILDCEMYAGNGTTADGPGAAARERARGRVRIAAFDLLSLNGQSLCHATPWITRRDFLEEHFGKRWIASLDRDGFRLTPVTDNAERLWAEWVVKYAGEGIVFKRKSSLYIPGSRSPYWLRMKPSRLPGFAREQQEGIMKEQIYLVLRDADEDLTAYGPIPEDGRDRAILEVMRDCEDLADPAGTATIYQMDFPEEGIPRFHPLTGGYMDKLRRALRKIKKLSGDCVIDEDGRCETHNCVHGRERIKEMFGRKS
jgi:hypothetical protein